MNLQSSRISFYPSADVTSSVHDAGLLLLNISNGQMFKSNAIGAQIWRGVQERRSLDGIVNEISTSSHIDRLTAREHAVGFLVQLEQRALIQREWAL